MQLQHYYSLNQFLRERHGSKVIKLSIDGGFTCPNRDGRISYKGCLFCSERGSGDFTPSKAGDITAQLDAAASLLSSKWANTNKYIVYFQAFTNTYASLEELKSKYEEALTYPGVVGLAIATRPDCLSTEILDYLEALSKRTHLWVELGLQTIHEATAKLLNRGYPLSVFDAAVCELSKRHIETVVHLIVGLPYETKEAILESVKYISHLPLQGVKIHMLHILDDSPMGQFYLQNPFPLFEKDEYIALVATLLTYLPPHFVIHRLTGDGAKNHLIAPLWTMNKRGVLNDLHKYFRVHDIYQGKSLKDIEFKSFLGYNSNNK